MFVDGKTIFLLVLFRYAHKLDVILWYLKIGHTQEGKTITVVFMTTINNKNIYFFITFYTSVFILPSNLIHGERKRYLYL